MTAPKSTPILFDDAVVNHQQIAYWLKKRGQLANNASDLTQASAVEAYIQSYKSKQQQVRQVNDFYGKSHYKAPLKSAKQKSSKAEKETTVKALTLLIDFPDLPHDNNRLSSTDTPLYYDDYSIAHYRTMLFDKDGYKGPNNQRLQTVYQYYYQESGGSFHFTGDVFGWFTAEHNAAHYGGNDDDDNDVNAEDLIIEAVAAVVASGVDLSPYDRNDPNDRDSDGILNEPDGIVDHLIVFHSSIGEEAGGGVLATDAIWAHRTSIGNSPVIIPGSGGMKAHFYTIQPIDSGIGIIAHEFGHDLGLDDEYDTASFEPGSPVGYWSLMASGSWLGKISGTEPSTLSPLAREHLQQTFGGKWLNQRVINSADLLDQSQELTLVEAVNHNTGINQIKVELPTESKQFKQPFSGDKLFYSGQAENTTASFDFSVTLPSTGNAMLSMQAQWDIEKDYDYAQIHVNGTALSNAQTVNTVNPTISHTKIQHYLTGQTPLNQWQHLVFDLADYAGQTVTISVSYVTDTYITPFGLVIDDIKVTHGSDILFSDDAESTPLVALSGFEQIGTIIEQEPSYYYLQLRSHNGADSGLPSKNYEPGLLVWYRNDDVKDNNVSEHPGSGFISVVDADQMIIGNESTAVQIRDAALSLFAQKASGSDNSLTAISSFSDSNDYSSPQQKESGVILPLWGISLAITHQETDSSLTSFTLSREKIDFTSAFNASRNGLNVTFIGQVVSSYPVTSYSWHFGDGNTSTLVVPTHTYQQTGQYNVRLDVINSAGETASVTKKIVVAQALELTASMSQNLLDVRFEAVVTGGVAPYQYQWDFGDNSALITDDSPSYSYSNSGVYDVVVMVTDAVGQVQTATLRADVDAGLAVNFSSVKQGLTVDFTADISAGLAPLMIEWRFGDGQTSRSENPSHTFATAGTYKVALAVSDQSGQTVTRTKDIIVSQAVAEKKSGGFAWSLFILAMAAFYWRKHRQFD
ncbi:immune inhibitor A domain-containing protein [Psychrobium sp. 1_MG-2023]|uniref:immune inhibitor A domain-containing protein n=1 Tax=Psychrobium sp. 1_MG-2023 TaxID=3062624 RepID=UPI0027371476|nr:immune inhibitor A domain-containing protein [Psychrobium sp. 1_MG-2023]